METLDFIILGLFLIFLVSIPLVLSNGHSLLVVPLLSIVRSVVPIVKLFGLALLSICSLGLGIALWEYSTQRWGLRKNSDAAQASHGQLRSVNASTQRERLVLPVVLIVSILSLLAVFDKSLFSSSEATSFSSTMDNASNSLFQFALALIILGLVILFLLINKDEYHSWRERRRLLKQSRRATRQLHPRHPTHR
ncbi:hypothetical protein O181_077739 [Austropuccinia psidii MF-1]|uniref:Uncharacterized protein n=1 Tax=Austropuccinia psidii MF-1 TaxID=1389203 RepID=A0A9Q3FFI5_9BASI|nr:hypothetical protein [Austropuccinia psidii MF-1]